MHVLTSTGQAGSQSCIKHISSAAWLCVQVQCVLDSQNPSAKEGLSSI